MASLGRSDVVVLATLPPIHANLRQLPQVFGDYLSAINDHLIVKV